MFKTPEGRGFPGFSVKIAKGILKVPGRSVSLLKETDNGDGGVERFVCMSWEMLCIEKACDFAKINNRNICVEL